MSQRTAVLLALGFDPDEVHALDRPRFQGLSVSLKWLLVVMISSSVPPFLDGAMVDAARDLHLF